MEHYCRHAESNVNSRSVDGYMRQAIIKVGERFGRKVLVELVPGTKTVASDLQSSGQRGNQRRAQLVSDMVTGTAFRSSVVVV
jgi:hypothetical protein